MDSFQGDEANLLINSISVSIFSDMLAGTKYPTGSNVPPFVTCAEKCRPTCVVVAHHLPENDRSAILPIILLSFSKPPGSSICYCTQIRLCLDRFSVGQFPESFLDRNTMYITGIQGFIIWVLETYIKGSVPDIGHTNHCRLFVFPRPVVDSANRNWRPK